MRILKLRNLIVLAALGSLVTFSSCDGDDDSSPDPSLKLFGENFIDENTTIQRGDTARFSWNASNGGSDLTRFTIDYVEPGGSSTQIFDSSNLSDNNATKYEDNFGITLSQTGEHNFTFRIEEENGNSTEKSIAVTVEGLNQYTAIMMGADKNSEFGSFYSTSENTVYKVSEVNGDNSDNRSLVDFIYFYGSTNNASIAAPSDETVTEFDVYNVPNWSDGERNSTNFSTSLDLSFSEINSGNIDQVRSAVEGSNSTLANKLSEDDVVGFKTESDDAGAFRVESISSKNRSGSIELSVKVE